MTELTMIVNPQRCGFPITDDFFCGMIDGHLPSNVHGHEMTKVEWAEYERTRLWNRVVPSEIVR